MKKIKFVSALFFIFAIVVLNFSIAFAVQPGGGANGGCTSGGPGSNSCTITYEAGGSGGGVGGTASASCSVSCNTGYYACCNLSGSFPFVSCSCIGNG